MDDDYFDPAAAYGFTFWDLKLARCVRETAKMTIENITELRCFRAGIRDLRGIEQLPNLMVLDLHLNEVEDGGPLARLRHLKELHLGLNQCSALDFLAGMDSLENLTLFDNEIEDITPLRGLTRLSVLHLRFNAIDDVSALRNLTEVRELSLSSNLIDDLSPLAAMTRMEMLNVYRNSIRDISPLANMKQLREIYLGENPVADISVLYEMPNLVTARIENTQVPLAHREYLEGHLARNRARLGLPPE
ncbi:MAG: leucine-rich repeat domain-containing protein [Myxococcota bacterium]